MNNDEMRFRQIAAKTIAEEIRTINQKDYAELKKKSKKTLRTGWSLIAAATVGCIVLYHQIDNIPKFVSSSAILILVFLGLYFVYKSENLENKIFEDRKNDRKQIAKLYKDFSGLMVGGQIVSGTITNEWSEIVVDHGDVIEKIMARFIKDSNNRVRIETKPILTS